MRYYYLLLILAGFGLLGLTAPLSEGLSLFSEPIIAQTTTPAAPQPIFQPILSELTAKTTIPIRLPQSLPPTGSNPLYANLVKATPTSYRIELAFVPDCYGASACRFGELGGDKITQNLPPLQGKKTVLSKGITGYYTPAVCGANCSDGVLVWQQEGVRYHLALKAGKLEDLKSLANSVITAKPLVSGRKIISATGIGTARLGMTYGELQQQLSPTTKFLVKQNFQVDFDAIAVVQGKEVEYYILYPAGEKLQAQDQIKFLKTDNPNYLTSAGVGAGTSLSAASKIYGKPTLFYNQANESREYVKFAQQPAKNIYFRVRVKSGGLAGIYARAAQEYQETEKFKPEAFIQSVEVILYQ
jgi:hypothetical protein